MRVLRYFPVQMGRGDDVLKDHKHKHPYYEFLRYKWQLADPLVDKNNVNKLLRPGYRSGSSQRTVNNNCSAWIELLIFLCTHFTVMFRFYFKRNGFIDL